MKTRFIRQIRQINEMLSMFRETKSKCLEIMRRLKVDETELDEYKQVEKLFTIDLNILGHEHLIQRKNKLMQGIDNIMKLETKLSVRTARQLPEIDQEEEQQSSNSTRSGFKQFNNFSQLIGKEPKAKSKAEQPKNIEAKKDISPIRNVRSIEDQRRFNEVLGKLQFNGSQLTTIWQRNKAPVEQTVEDKFDRISRTLGALRKNGRTIYEQERLKTSCINLLDYTEFTQIITSLERMRMQNQDLRYQIIKLTEENRNLKNSTEHTNRKDEDLKSKKQTQHHDVSMQTQPQVFYDQEIMLETVKFKIVKFYKEELEMDSFGIEKQIISKDLDMQQSCILKNFNNDIGDSVIECMVDVPLQKNDSYQYFPASQRLNTYQQEVFGGLSFNKRVKTEFNPQNIARNQMVLGSIIQSKDLNQVQNKLREIRENRKKIVNDDDLWSQVQNMRM